MQRIILHIDFNSYFASVEQQDNPTWRNKPVGVCEHLGGIIIAASVEAKRWGITTGTPVWEARRLYPKIILSPTHPDRYRFYTRKFLNVLQEYSLQVELYSIDEAFMDATWACNIRVKNKYEWQWADPFEEAINLARQIKRHIKNDVGEWLRVSIGIGWNKLTAKIASDKMKPNGLTVFHPQNKLQIIRSLALVDVPGINFRLAKRLGALGIYTLWDLYKYPRVNLTLHLGILGWHLWHFGQLENSCKDEVMRVNEIDANITQPNQREVNTKTISVKSMGHMYTLPKMSRKPGMAVVMLAKLSAMLGARLRLARLAAGRVAIYGQMETVQNMGFSASRKLSVITQDEKEIWVIGKQLLIKELQKQGEGNGDVLERLSPKIIGVSVSALELAPIQLALFGYWNKRKKMLAAQDDLNRRLGEGSVMFASGFFGNRVIKDSIGFGRIRESNF